MYSATSCENLHLSLYGHVLGSPPPRITDWHSFGPEWQSSIFLIRFFFRPPPPVSLASAGPKRGGSDASRSASTYSGFTRNENRFSLSFSLDSPPVSCVDPGFDSGLRGGAGTSASVSGGTDESTSGSAMVDALVRCDL
jgi:hypothetical protein